jgi:hypothetical protein
MHLSRGGLQRLFKKEMGVPISAYLTEQRLLKAARLLKASSLSIKEIAFAVGYITQVSHALSKAGFLSHPDSIGNKAISQNAKDCGFRRSVFSSPVENSNLQS